MPFFLESDHISEVGLSNLKLYRYASVDKSPISKYILKPYLDRVIELFPLWMAPNLITLCGFGFILINLTCVCIFVRDLTGPAASWLYFSFAAGLWLYLTFDNIDGRQARRTGTSSPLGELFDHGCDALNCSLGAMIQSAAMGLGHSWYSAFLLVLTTAPFYISTWEEYQTGVLYLGYINGPTEGLITACIVMVMSGILGPEFWKTGLNDVFGSATPEFVKDYTLTDLMFAFITLMVLICLLPVSFYNVYKTCQRQGRSFLSTLPQHLSFSVYVVSGYLWLASPFSHIFEDENFILFALTIGIVFGRMATKIILAHVTKTDFPMFTVQLIPLLVGAILTNVPVVFHTKPILTPKFEYYYLWSYFGFVLIAYIYWATIVIRQFRSYLKIRCLHIPHRRPESDDDEAEIS
jgi:ethanolaminephosphotransferase